MELFPDDVNSWKSHQQTPNGQAPIHCKLCHRRISFSIDSPGHSAPSWFQRGVSTHYHSVDHRTVRLSSVYPIAKGLPEGVVYPVANVKKHGAEEFLAIQVVNVLLATMAHPRIVPKLELVYSAPDGHARHQQQQPANKGAGWPSKAARIKNKTHENAPKHLRHPIQIPIERSRPQIKRQTIDVVLLIGVENVGSIKHGVQAQVPPAQYSLGGLHQSAPHIFPRNPLPFAPDPGASIFSRKLLSREN